MTRFKWVVIGILIGAFLALNFLWFGLTGNALAGKGGQSAAATPIPPADEGRASGLSFSVTGGDEILSTGIPQDILAPNALPTPVPGETTVYFVPTDNDATATVLYLYNTDSVQHTVALRGFSYSGTLVYSLNISVAATSFLRLASDSIASSPPPSWATPAPIITNFTDFTYFASLSLPKGVKVEGYTLYNPGTGVVDPRSDQGAVPLRFSTDPATVFLPVLQTSP